jgi:hypothetical protein
MTCTDLSLGRPLKRRSGMIEDLYLRKHIARTNWMLRSLVFACIFFARISHDIPQAKFDSHVIELVAQIKDLLEENETLSTAWSDVEEQRREHLAALEMMQVACDYIIGSPFPLTMYGFSSGSIDQVHVSRS